MNPDGSYKFLYETGNGIFHEEEGSVKNAGTDEEAHVSILRYTTWKTKQKKNKASDPIVKTSKANKHLPTTDAAY